MFGLVALKKRIFEFLYKLFIENVQYVLVSCNHSYCFVMFYYFLKCNVFYVSFPLFSPGIDERLFKCFQRNVRAVVNKLELNNSVLNMPEHFQIGESFSECLITALLKRFLNISGTYPPGNLKMRRLKQTRGTNISSKSSKKTPEQQLT